MKPRPSYWIWAVGVVGVFSGLELKMMVATYVYKPIHDAYIHAPIHDAYIHDIYTNVHSYAYMYLCGNHIHHMCS